MDWIKHRLDSGESAPSAEMIGSWFDQKPASWFDDKLKTALNRFDGYARGYLADEIEQAKRRAAYEAVSNLQASIDHAALIINDHVTQRTKGTGFLIGIASNFAFGILVFVLLVVLPNTPDVSSWLLQHWKTMMATRPPG